MFPSTRNTRTSSGAAVVDIAPLIDVVFLLLLFFLVTATFTRESGVQVQRPRASSATRLPPESLRISVTRSGAVFTEGRQVDLDGLRRRVEDFCRRGRSRAVVIIADERVPAGRVVRVMDSARMGGAGDVALAARRENAP